MKKELLATAVALALGFGVNAQEQKKQPDAGAQQANEMVNKMKEEAAVYYAGADTADYGVRYRLRYLCNKKKNIRFEEDRVVLINPDVTLDMSYQGIGETRWRMANPKGQGGDRSLAYHLTPDFYFYYPSSGRMVRTYRIVSEEFLLDDAKCENNWKITDEEKKIGEYNCRKATLDRGGRQWAAWFTTDLPHWGAPRTFAGLPGVVLEVADADREVCWMFNGLVNSIPDSKLYIKMPEKFAQASPEEFRKILRVFSLSDNSYVQQSGVMNKNSSHYPEKYSPSTGIDACEIDNPIER
ncbi:MAG: GLPGLI family protein [Duncaniella sp.]|nr:GLPGLI family protein [Duncaniella sp.]